MKTKILFLLMAATVVFLGASKAMAAGGTGLLISPPLKEITANPGATISDVVKVTNPNSIDLNLDLNISVTSSDFIAKGEDGGQDFVDPETNTSSFSLAKWITLNTANFMIKANETREVPYTINVPANAEPGGHYGVVFFTPSPVNPQTLTGSGAVVVPKVGALLLVNVPGDIKYDGRIAEFGVDKKLFIQSKNTVNLFTRFENKSTTHVKPEGKITIKNTLGKEVASLTVNESAGNVLPESIRKFANDWEKKYGFGLYKASVNLTYADNKSVAETLSFWIIPWKETTGGLVVLIIIIWMLSHIQWKKPSVPKPSPSATVPNNNPPAGTPPTPPIPPTGTPSA